MENSQHLAVVLDLNQYYWKDVREIQEACTDLVRFGNVFLAQSQLHHLSFLLCNQDTSILALEATTELDVDMLLAQVKEMLDSSISEKTAGLSSALSKCLCSFNQRWQGVGKHSGRILIVSPSADYPEHYVALMNSAFTAQKLVIWAHLVHVLSSGRM